ncbi:hypothetical protein MMH89_01675 [Candidatus Comchoanobacter bicostacola]|uniref:Uncharacterized protein n=1 Tax=Candidatus Comchoanobacter bicostacola TaxID=2919598 RepID=A0ABY5DMY7_9GAMM|nr:hypothetical protein [Candidatus Comchoanobacter bicostacola]UTC24859.1 hypothetical protein MMH89_01675 [Candidatus Comchoanobacter bicostacola]
MDHLFLTQFQQCVATINNILDDSDQGSEQRKKSIAANEGLIQEEIKALHELDQKSWKSWFCYLVLLKPKLIHELSLSMLALIDYRATFSELPADTDSGLGVLDPVLNDRVGKQCHRHMQCFMDVIHGYVKPHVSRGLGEEVTCSGLLESMHNHMGDIFEKEKAKSMRVHIIIQIVALTFAVAGLSVMGSLYFLHAKYFAEYFIACLSVVAVSLLTMTIDYFCIYKRVKKDFNIMEGASRVRAPSESSQDGFDEVSLFDGANLPGNNAVLQAHRF